MDGQTNGLMEESDFIGHCPTNVEHPKTRNEMKKQSTATYSNNIYDGTN